MKKRILLSFLAVALVMGFAVKTADAAEMWDLTGSYTVDFTCTSGCVGVYPHSLTVTVSDVDTGVLGGNGSYIPNGAYTWDMTGTLSGSDVTMHLLYTGLNPGYFTDLVGVIAPDGTLSGTALSSTGQTFDWETTTGVALFLRDAMITSPDTDEIVDGEHMFTAWLMDNDYDAIQWAVRSGTCAAGTNTVAGNVDGFSTPFNWVMSGPYMYEFDSTIDTSGWTGGMYCVIFNPVEDGGEANIRLTREFYVADGDVHGGGQLIEEKGTKMKDWYKISFGGHAWDLGSAGYVGEWQINFHNVGVSAYDKGNFHSTEIVDMNFFAPDSGTCDEAMNMEMLGTFNGEPGWRVIFRAGDDGAPGTSDYDDTVRIELFKGAVKMYETNLAGEFASESSCVGTSRTGLDHGNITIMPY